MSEATQNNIVFRKHTVVVSLLDWGLGHITRSVPIIKHLISLNCNIIIACNQTQKALLVKEFDQVEYVHCRGYDIHYRKTPLLTRLALVIQAPKILTRIKQENRWLSGFLKERKVDLIISDNRYGFYSPDIRSVIITHQLQIETGFGKRVNRWVNKLNHRWIGKFQECWVPDFEEAVNCAGTLSHPEVKPPFSLRYLGAISRLEKCRVESRSVNRILCILSGPEPQRSMLEKIIVLQASQQTKYHIILVRGLPNTDTTPLPVASNVETYQHLSATDLNQLVCTADFVVSRAGYTSIMDFLKLGIKSILIPTPGQAEQEYLAKYMEQENFAICCRQEKFILDEMIDRASTFNYKRFDRAMDEYKKAINDFLNELPTV